MENDPGSAGPVAVVRLRSEAVVRPWTGYATRVTRRNWRAWIDPCKWEVTCHILDDVKFDNWNNRSDYVELLIIILYVLFGNTVEWQNVESYCRALLLVEKKKKEKIKIKIKIKERGKKRKWKSENKSGRRSRLHSNGKSGTLNCNPWFKALPPMFHLTKWERNVRSSYSMFPCKYSAWTHKLLHIRRPRVYRYTVQ